MGVTSSLSSVSETEVGEEFVGGFLLSGVLGDFFSSVDDIISLGVLDNLFIGVSFNRVSEALFAGTFFSFTAILRWKIKYYKG